MYAGLAVGGSKVLPGVGDGGAVANPPAAINRPPVKHIHNSTARPRVRGRERKLQETLAGRCRELTVFLGIKGCIRGGRVRITIGSKMLVFTVLVTLIATNAKLDASCPSCMMMPWMMPTRGAFNGGGSETTKLSKQSILPWCVHSECHVHPINDATELISRMNGAPSF